MADIHHIGLGVEQARLVACLERLTAKARDGKLKVIIAATIDGDGVVGFVHMGLLSSTGDNVTEYAKAVGMVSALHHDVDCTLHGMLVAEEDESETQS